MYKTGRCGGLISLITSLSSIFDVLQRSEIGRKEVSSLKGLLVLRKGMIFPTFQMLGLPLLLSEWLKMLVRGLMAFGPKCFG